MAFFDNSLLLSNAQAITVTAASTNLYDVTGAGSGVVPSMVFGSTGLAGFDIGTGEGIRPSLYLTVGTAFVSGGGATLTVQIQAAVDNGSGSPGSYTTIAETGLLLAAALTAGAVIQLPIPPLTPGEALPRFYRVNYVVATSTFSAGTLTGGIMITPPTQVNKQYPSNFSAA